MERYNSRLVDELGRITIPSQLRKELEINTGDKISLTVVSTIVIMEKAARDADATDVGIGADSYICETNELGMITLPLELRQQMGWQTKDELPLYHTDNLMILKSEIK